MSISQGRVSWMLVLSCCGYVSGLATQVLMSYYFGTAVALDAYWVAFAVLNAFAFYVHPVREALVPGFYQRLRSSQEAGNAYFTHALLLFGSLAAVFTSAMALGADLWSTLATSAHAPPGLRSDAASLMLVLAVALPLFAISEMLNALLACYDRILLQQGVRLVGTVVNLLCLVAFADNYGVAAMAAGFVLGQALMACLQSVLLFRLGVRLRWPHHSRLDAPFYKVSGSFVLAAVFAQGYALYEKNSITLFGAGWVSAMQYAVTIVNVLITVFAASVVNLLWPRLLAASSAADRTDVRGAVTRGGMLLLLALVPACFFCYLEARAIIELLFARGSFGADSLDQTSTALRATIFAAVPVALTTLLVRALVTLRQARALAGIGFTIAAAGSIMLGMAQVTADIRPLLVHWLVGNTAGVAVAMWLFTRSHPISIPELGVAARWLLRLAFAVASMCVAWSYVSYILPSSPPVLLRLAATGSTCLASFVIAAIVIGLLPRRGWRTPENSGCTDSSTAQASKETDAS